MKKVVHVIYFIMLIMFLAACSNSEKDEILEQVQISVERTGGLLTGIGKVKVYIDDEEVMKVKNNKTETLEMSMSTGIHTIQTKGQGDKSDVVEFEVVAGANNIFHFNTEISNVYGVKLKLLKQDNGKQEDTQNEEEVEEEVSINGITKDEAINLSKRLPSYSDLVANGDTFAEPRVHDDVWAIDISRPNGLAEGSIIIDKDRTVSFMYPNGDVDEVTPYGETVTSTQGDTQNETSQADLDVVPVQGANNTAESARDQIGYLIMYYLQTYTDGDTASLGNYIYPSSAFYSEQENYMESLNSRGIVLDLIDYELISIEQIADKKYEVNADEYYTIDHPEKGLSDTKQTSKYTVELIDGEFYITGVEL
ncbi:TcaA NTF2-like domain-containing protein [Cytobacillus massiliigabonensis]|uniref:TcaA NTF2-like domain-containing protein n=1 Tax=Cytobacillus massiliigabonensis TaxID=1871011 RepID=UPI000C82242C|nr:hypothetical protein [Cytobacillus massiliigabonensis]